MSKTTINQIWPGCDFCKKELNDYPFITAIGEYGDSVNSHTPQYCPLCGRPLTPEAWEEMKKKLEALKDETQRMPVADTVRYQPVFDYEGAVMDTDIYAGMYWRKMCGISRRNVR